MTENNVKFTALKDDGAGSGENLGPLIVIRSYREGGKLLTFNNGEKSEADLAPGYTVEGIYEGAKIEKTPKGKDSIEYKIRATDGSNSLTMIKACSALNNAKTGLAAVAEGSLVQVVFERMVTTKNGNDFAVFTVLTADEAAAG